MLKFIMIISLIYLLIVYLLSKFGKIDIRDAEKKIWAFLCKYWKDNTQGSVPAVTKTVPPDYAERIHDSVKNYTNNGFDTTIWGNDWYSDYKIPCFYMDMVPVNNDIDTDLPLIEVQALDRFRKCTLPDNILRSRIKSDKLQGKVYLYILYASNKEELKRYNLLLQREKEHADKAGLKNSAPVSDSTLQQALDSLDSTTDRGGIHANY